MSKLRKNVPFSEKKRTRVNANMLHFDHFSSNYVSLRALNSPVSWKKKINTDLCIVSLILSLSGFVIFVKWQLIRRLQFCFCVESLNCVERGRLERAKRNVWLMVIHVCVGFALLSFWLAWKYRATFSSNKKYSQNQSWITRTRFPALCASYMYLSFDWFTGLSV